MMLESPVNEINIKEHEKVISVNLLDLAQMLSESVDLMEDGVYHHGQRVAYIAFKYLRNYIRLRTLLT